MRILIHAVPERMWYVSEFLVPSLEAQGADNIEIWNDTEHQGNLAACIESFATRKGNGGTWHLQDDVLICRNFVERCLDLDEGVVYGFCCRNFGDRLDAGGTVYCCDGWNSFQCVRIPDAYARECAAWVRSMKWRTQSPSPELPIMWQLNKGDDTFFHEFLACRHPYDAVENVKPNLVDHVDWILGGSTLHHFRDYLARAEFFEDQDLIEELRAQIRARSSVQT